MKTAVILALALFSVVSAAAEESPDVLALEPKSSASALKPSLPVSGNLYECLGDNCPFQLSMAAAAEETINAQAEAFELDQGLAQLRDQIDNIRGRIAQVSALERIRLQLPVRQIRNQLKMANRFGKRDKLRMSNRFG